MKYLRFLPLLALLSCVQEPAKISINETNKTSSSLAENLNPHQIIVKESDTIYSIAKKNDVEIRQIIDANNLWPPYKLETGQILRVPNATFHPVGKGDFLHAIARSYGVSVGHIIKANNLNAPYIIYPGMRIKIPYQTEEDSEVLAQEDNNIGTSNNQNFVKNNVKNNNDWQDGAALGLPENNITTNSNIHSDNIPTSDIDQSTDINETKLTNKEGQVRSKALQPLEKIKVKDLSRTENHNKRSDKIDRQESDVKNYSKSNKTAFKEEAKINLQKDNITKEPKTTWQKSNIEAKNNDEFTFAPPPNDTKSQNNKPDYKIGITDKFAQSNKISKTDNDSPGNLSFIKPVDGKVISRFGPKKGGLLNEGINIKAKEGTIVKAAETGEVIYAGNELKDYGNLILVKHSNGFVTAYAHLDELEVKKGQLLKKGQNIGKIGQTGRVKSPQLHFSIRHGRKALNPEKYISSLAIN